MPLTWSHAVMYVNDLDAMLAFYEGVLGFKVSDRGPVAEGGPEIIFLSQLPGEHHQLAMLPLRKDVAPSNSVNHMAFRTPDFEDLAALNARLADYPAIKTRPLSHGNTLSLYFADPEGNGIEVFWDTPWHVDQPQGKPWDVSLSKADALAWAEAAFQDEPGFGPA